MKEQFVMTTGGLRYCVLHVTVCYVLFSQEAFLCAMLSRFKRSGYFMCHQT